MNDGAICRSRQQRSRAPSWPEVWPALLARACLNDQHGDVPGRPPAVGGRTSAMRQWIRSIAPGQPRPARTVKERRAPAQRRYSRLSAERSSYVPLAITVRFCLASLYFFGPRRGSVPQLQPSPRHQAPSQIAAPGQPASAPHQRRQVVLALRQPRRVATCQRCAQR